MAEILAIAYCDKLAVPNTQLYCSWSHLTMKLMWTVDGYESDMLVWDPQRMNVPVAVAMNVAYLK